MRLMSVHVICFQFRRKACELADRAGWGPGASTLPAETRHAPELGSPFFRPDRARWVVHLRAKPTIATQMRADGTSCRGRPELSRWRTPFSITCAPCRRAGDATRKL